MITLQRQRLGQPIGGEHLRRSNHPIGAGLVLAIHNFERRNYKDGRANTTDVIRDYSGLGNHATNYAASASSRPSFNFGDHWFYTNIKPFGVAHFDAYDSTHYTIEMWLRITGSAGGARRYLYRKGGSGASSANEHWGIGINDSVDRFFIEETGASINLGDDTFGGSLRDTFHQMVIVLSDNDLVTDPILGYRDGVFAFQNNTDANITPNTSQVTIGGSVDYGGEWVGDIASTRVWTRRLSAGEIAALYRDPWLTFERQRIHVSGAATVGKTGGVIRAPRWGTRITQPRPGTPVDWSNPLTAGLVFLRPCNEGSGNWAEIARGEGKWGSTNNLWARNKWGLTSDYPSASSNNTTVTTYVGPVGSSARTIAVWINTDTVTSSTRLLGYGDILSNYTKVGFRLDSAASHSFRVEIQGARINGTASVNDGEDHLLVWAYPEGGQLGDSVLYVDGKVDPVSLSTNPTNVLATNSAPLSIGDDPNASAPWVGTIGPVAIWDRALSGGEVVRLTRNFWQIFRPNPVLIGTPAPPRGGMIWSPVYGRPKVKPLADQAPKLDW